MTDNGSKQYWEKKVSKCVSIHFLANLRAGACNLIKNDFLHFKSI